MPLSEASRVCGSDASLSRNPSANLDSGGGPLAKLHSLHRLNAINDYLKKKSSFATISPLGYPHISPSCVRYNRSQFLNALFDKFRK